MTNEAMRWSLPGREKRGLVRPVHAHNGAMMAGSQSNDDKAAASRQRGSWEEHSLGGVGMLAMEAFELQHYRRRCLPPTARTQEWGDVQRFVALAYDRWHC